MMELRNSDMTEYHWKLYIYKYISFSTIITCTSVLIPNYILKYFKRRGRTMCSSIYFVIEKEKIILKIEKI